MQKILITSLQLDFNASIQANKPIYNTVSKTHLVASTKSLNKLIKEEYTANGITPTKIKVEDVFVDKKQLESTIKTFVETQTKDEFLKKEIAKHICNVLERGCIYGE